MSTLGTVEEILRIAKVPMTVKEIVEQAGTRLPTRSRTPHNVVARDLSLSLKIEGSLSRFVRTAPGRYTLREYAPREFHLPKRHIPRGKIGR